MELSEVFTLGLRNSEQLTETPVEAVDIVVIGGGMAGVMAALSAKTANNKVLLVEPSNVLGGQGTAGGVAGFCGDTELVNCFFEELVARLAAHDLIEEIHPTADRRGYDLEWCAFFLQEMVTERGIEVLLHSRVIDADAENGVVKSLTISTAGSVIQVAPQFVIDSSGACIVPVLTGFPVVHEGANKQLPMSLYFTMWDTGKKVKAILPEGCPKWTNDDEIPMTSLHMFPNGKTEVKMKVVGFDAADGRSRSEAEIFARRYMHGLIYYLQTVGYRGVLLDTSVLASVSRSIGIREERRIVGEHVLTEHEVRHATIFPDAIGVCAYHLDYHWPDRMQRGTGGYCDMLDPHHLPLRMMIPKGAKNLLVAGRGSSGDQLAMSAFRVMIPVAQLGFAAGLAARQCIETGTDLTNIDVPKLQEAIRAGGQTLDLSAYGRYLRHDLFTREEVFSEARAFTKESTSSLVQVSNARFLLAWVEHESEGIWLGERRERVWSEPRVVAKISEAPHWNPVLVRAEDDTLRLYFKTGAERSRCQSWVMKSRDEGATWEDAVPFGESPYGAVKNKVVVCKGGAWKAPNAGGSEAWVDVSKDKGATWQRAGGVGLEAETFADGKEIRPALWESTAGLQMMLASARGKIFQTDSADGGKTWTAVRETELPHAGGGLDVARLDDGTLALVFCPRANRLAIALSRDNGATWPNRLELEEEGEACANPALIATRTGMAITYFLKGRQMVFWHGSVERIPAWESN
ncbi:hypothetical protein BH09VER1_BH09VER1_25520 [soil metagenome]